MAFWNFLILLIILSNFEIAKTHNLVKRENLIRRARSSVSEEDEEPNSIDKLVGLLPDDYNYLDLPPSNDSNKKSNVHDVCVKICSKGKPLQIGFSVLIMGIWNVDESHELITVDMKIQIYWQDTRLKHLSNLTSPKSPLVLKPQLLSELWHPDIYIEKVKSITHEAILSSPASLKIFPDNVVRYSARLTVTMSCQMEFHYYPVDTQKCHFDIQNYSYDIKKLKMGWKRQRATLLGGSELPNFYVGLDSLAKFNVTSTTGSVYSGIRFTVELRRKLSYHLLQTYLPSTIFILVSWLSFILPYNSTSEKMGYCMTCLFTLTSMFSAVRQSTPNVSYIKALDIWMVTCVFFVFLTLIQHALISKLRRCKTLEKIASEKSLNSNENLIMRKQDRDDGLEAETSFSRNIVIVNKNCSISSELDKESCGEGKNNSEGSKDSSEKENLTIFQKIMKKTDRYLSLTVPLLFLFFNCIYWTWLIRIKYYS